MKLINIFLLAAILCSCASQFGPFVDRRREAGGLSNGALYVGKSTETNPAICYNRLYTSFDEVQKLADEECVKNKAGSHAVPKQETIFSCRLLVPNHYYFECEK